MIFLVIPRIFKIWGDSQCASKPRAFVVGDTVRYVPTGEKVRVIRRVVESRGFNLVPTFRGE